MEPRDKLRFCIVVNTVLLVVVLAFVFAFADSSAGYWGFGPSDDLYVISIKVDSWSKYFGILIVAAMIQVIKVVVEEFGMPVVGFSIYNPDKREIDDFTKNELQFYGNAMFLTSAIRDVFLIVISVTRVDLALWNVIVGEITTIYTIRVLLNEKTFAEDKIARV